MIGDRWGVTEAEVARRYPCDELAAGVELWRGVTVRGPAEQVWPWLCQVQLAPYSYDWVDNLGRPSPRELRGLPDPRPGEPFTTCGGRFRLGTVLAVEHEVHLTARILSAVMSYVLVPDPAGTRLLLKLVLPRRWWARLVGLGDWPMARRQLLNLRDLAEGRRAGPHGRGGLRAPSPF